MKDRFYTKKKFWGSVIGVLTAAGALSPAYSETAFKILQMIIGD